MTKHKDSTIWIIIGIALILGAAILYFLLSPQGSNYVTIKYRDDKVNISASNFEPLSKSDSNLKGAWYDGANEYMVIKLNSTYYHYCGMPSSAWASFKSTSYPYTYYLDDIKGNFDCRINHVPSY